jgi:pterin-4a-carbinolamine dehydratase
MAYYYSIPIEEMEEELESLRFYPVNLVFRNKPVKEWVYERKLPRSPNHFVRIYTGIQRYGQSAGESRKAGKDAIRIQVIYRDAKGETLVSQTKRVHRVGGWRKNLHKRMDEVATELPQVEFDSRGEPMTLRKKGKNQFWGSRDYPKFKETKPFRAEEIRCCKECDKTTGLTTIQAGTYCYDCLPINLGAEDIIYVSPNEEVYIDAKIEIIKNTGQKVARIDMFASPKGNGFGRAEFENFKDWAYKQGAAYIVVESVPESVNFWKWMGFIEPFGLVEPKDEFLAKHLGLNTLIYLAESEAKGGQFAAEDEINIIDLNSKKEIEEYGMFRPYEPNPPRKEELRRKSLTDAPENNNLFRINCDGVYAVRTIYGPSKIIFGRNMLASNKVSFNRAAQRNLSGVWELMGLPRNKSGVVSAFGPLENIEKMPQFSEKPAIHLINKRELTPNRIVINMKGLVFAYDIVNREVEFYGGVPESSIVSEDILPEWVNPQEISKPLFAAEDNYEATYGVEQAKIRRKLKNKIKKQAIMGTKAGQWSARKSQELKRQYEAACDKKGLNPYKGKKTKSQDNLSKWSKQKWGTASGKKSSTTGEPYFPAKAVAALKKKDLYSKAKRQKAKATRAGKQNARYSDDIRKVVAQYRAEDEDIVIADFKNMSKKERDTYAPDNWKIEMYWAADGSTYILRRIFKPESYGAVVDLIDEINVIAAELDHHALITFDKERVMVQLWTHDVHNITELDIAFAELLNQFADKWELNAESPEWDDIDWKTDKPPVKEHEDWGDDVEWDAEDEEITMREFDDTTAEDFVDDADDRIVLMLRKKSKINRYGDIGCPVCGSIGLFYEEIIAKGKKWYCYGCLYEDKEETIKGKGDITLEKYGLEITCPICKKAVKAFNNDSMLRHMKKCGVPK